MDNFSDNNPESYLVYLDANNLYGWAMSQALPYGGFEWVDGELDFNVSDSAEEGYILEVDLTHLHEIMTVWYTWNN